jgi:hypothetical protein
MRHSPPCRRCRNQYGSVQCRAVFGPPCQRHAGLGMEIGGSYLENESRLSDISLKWMVHAAVNLPDATGPTGHGLKISPSLLQLRPDPLGPQHDEREPGFLWGIRWPKGLRRVDPEAALHSSVYVRAAAKQVPHF